MNNHNNLKKPRNSKKIRSFGGILQKLHNKLASNPGTRNFIGFAALVVLVCVVFGWAALEKEETLLDQQSGFGTHPLPILVPRSIKVKKAGSGDTSRRTPIFLPRPRNQKIRLAQIEDINDQGGFLPQYSSIHSQSGSSNHQFV